MDLSSLVTPSVFFAPDALPEGTTPSTRARVAEALGKAEPAAEW